MKTTQVARFLVLGLAALAVDAHAEDCSNVYHVPNCVGGSCTIEARGCPGATPGTGCGWGTIPLNEAALIFISTLAPPCPIDGNFNCNPQNACASQGKCVPKRDASGAFVAGSECIPKGCYLAPQAADPSRFDVACRASEQGHDDDDGAPQACHVGGARSQGDPVSIYDGRSLYSVTDIELPSTVRKLTFTRQYQSAVDQWARQATLGTTDTNYVPAPFGFAPSELTGISWWHNWYAFVFETPTMWNVRLPGGTLVSFSPCTPASGQHKCTVQPAPAYAEARASLVWDDAGIFTYYSMTGETFRFDKLLNTSTSDGGTERRYFLSELRDRATTGAGRLVATVAYGVPSGCTELPGIQAGTGVPMIQSVTAADGLSLFFTYTNRGPFGRNTNQRQCVLRKVAVGRTFPGTDAVLFEYSEIDSFAGDLGLVRNYLKRNADGSESIERFTYAKAAYEFRVAYGTSTSSAMAGIRHVTTTNGSIVPSVLRAYASAGGDSLSVAQLERVPLLATVGCPPNTSCAPTSAASATLTWSSRFSGEGLGRFAPNVRTATQARLGSLTMMRTIQFLNSTDAGLDVAASAGTRYEIGTTPNGPFNSAILGSRTDTVFTAAAAPTGPQIAVSAVVTGRGSETETTNYAYTYLGSPPLQLTSLEEQASVVPGVPTGAKARTHYRYDADGRLRAVIKEGYTRASGTCPTCAPWGFVQRFVGTFYVATDPLGRTTEVHGPCAVNDANALDCSDASYAKTAFTYYPVTGSNNDHRLWTVQRWASLPGTPLTTTYGSYDTLGNPLSVTDENNVVSNYVYDLAGQPTSLSIGGKVWAYSYDRGHLTKVTQPEGDSVVICYRRAPTLAAGCVASENPSEQPTGIFRYGAGQAGPNWYEAALLAYGADGELREETVYQQGNTTTPFRRTTREKNPLGFTTYEKVGVPRMTVS